MALRDQIDTTKRALSLGYHRPVDDPAKRTCRWCGGAVPAGRRSWCSQECVHEGLMRAQPGYARRKVFERDHGVCSACGLDCARLERIAERLRKLAGTTLYYSTITGKVVLSYWARTDPIELRPHPAAERRGRDLEVLMAILNLWSGHDLSCGDYAKFGRRPDGGTGYVRLLSLARSLWQSDHITPVVEGGGGCGLDNLRTLCTRCHHAETAALAHRRAVSKRRQPRK